MDVNIQNFIRKVINAHKRILELEAENASLKAEVEKLTAHNTTSLPPCRWCGETLGSDWVCLNAECLHHGE
jgi:hypothetical protein